VEPRVQYAQRWAGWMHRRALWCGNWRPARSSCSATAETRAFENPVRVYEVSWREEYPGPTNNSVASVPNMRQARRACLPLVICLQLSYLVGTIAGAAKGGVP